MAGHIDVIFRFFHLLGLGLVFPFEKTLAQQADRAAKEDGGEDDEREASGDNDATIRHVLVDAQHKTEGNGTSDQACIPDKEKLLASDALWVVLLVAAQLE